MTHSFDFQNLVQSGLPASDSDCQRPNSFNKAQLKSILADEFSKRAPHASRVTYLELVSLRHQLDTYRHDTFKREIQFLRRILSQDHVLFESGCGGIQAIQSCFEDIFYTRLLTKESSRNKIEALVRDRFRERMNHYWPAELMFYDYAIKTFGNWPRRKAAHFRHAVSSSDCHNLADVQILLKKH